MLTTSRPKSLQVALACLPLAAACPQLPSVQALPL